MSIDALSFHFKNPILNYPYLVSVLHVKLANKTILYVMYTSIKYTFLISIFSSCFVYCLFNQNSLIYITVINSEESTVILPVLRVNFACMIT